MPTITDIPVHDLAKHVKDAPGTVHLVGSNGGLSLIEGKIRPSATMPGCTYIETEHGTIYADTDSQVTITYATP